MFTATPLLNPSIFIGIFKVLIFFDNGIFFQSIESLPKLTLSIASIFF